MKKEQIEATDKAIELPKSVRKLGYIAIIQAKWHRDITQPMAEAAKQYLLDKGLTEEQIRWVEAPGAFELPHLAKMHLDKSGCAGVVAIGCLIKGDTDHYHYIANSVSQSLCNLSCSPKMEGLEAKPVGFGLLTVDNKQQAVDRAGGKEGNKGAEAAEAVLECLVARAQL